MFITGCRNLRDLTFVYTLLLTFIFLIFLQTICNSQKLARVNTDSLAFIISLDSLSQNGMFSLNAILKNNTGHTIIFIKETCPVENNYVLETKELNFKPLDCLYPDHLLKITLAL